MDATQNSMLPAALELFLQSLPRFDDQGRETRWYVNKVAHDPSVAFSVAQKLPSGQRTPEGSNIKVWGKLTYRQCNQIERTSENVQEVVERFRAHILEGIDTTRTPRHAGPSSLDMEREIEKRWNAIIKDRLDELIDKRLAERANDPVPKGIQRAPHQPKSAGNPSPSIEAEWELWRTRAKAMGINEPIGRIRDKRIDGRWLRSAAKLWAEHQKGADVSGKRLVFGASGANEAVIEDAAPTS